MGLDMYLSGQIYAGKYSCEERHTRLSPIVEELGIPPSDHIDTITVNREVGYWRKANQIHQWFVDHVQSGVDNCQEHYVSRDQLKDLRATCLRVIQASTLVPGNIKNGATLSAETGGEWKDNIECGQVVLNRTVAEELLPTTAGFFFGSTEYDQYYIDDLKGTIAIIDKALALPDHIDFYYRSSW